MPPIIPLALQQTDVDEVLLIRETEMEEKIVPGVRPYLFVHVHPACNGIGDLNVKANICAHLHNLVGEVKCQN